MGLLADLRTYWREFVLVVTPLAALPLPILYESTEARCAYGLIIMAVYWVTEAMPLAATSLLPMVVFPALRVLSAKDVAINYLKVTNMLFLGGLMMATSVEHSNLHKRIALRITMIVGTSPVRLIFGVMFATWFLSMWISNTATTAMMLPVAHAVVTQLVKADASVENDEQQGTNQANTSFNTVSTVSENITESTSTVNIQNGDMSIDHDPEAQSKGSMKEKRQKNVNMFKAISLAIAYAANTGGIGTLTGTPPNLVIKNEANEYYKSIGAESPITYTTWMLYAVPIAVICLFIAWIWIIILFLGPRALCSCKPSQKELARRKKADELMRKEYEKLGGIRFAEVVNIVLFSILVLLWLTYNPQFVKGWGSLFNGYMADAVPAILMAVLVMAIPRELPRFFCCRKKGERPKKLEPIIGWNDMSRKLPWGVVILLGGGFALATACQKSGLSTLIGKQLEVVGNLPYTVSVMVVASLVAGLTEVTSNTATTTLIQPILKELALTVNLQPLIFMLPGCVAASFAFMLPVATPPNAIVFSYGDLKIFDMIKAGLLMNILCILVVTMATITWGPLVFQLGDISLPANSTFTS